jgi:hypothetical protein
LEALREKNLRAEAEASVALANESDPPRTKKQGRNSEMTEAEEARLRRIEEAVTHMLKACAHMIFPVKHPSDMDLIFRHFQKLNTAVLPADPPALTEAELKWLPSTTGEYTSGVDLPSYPAITEKAAARLRWHEARLKGGR